MSGPVSLSITAVGGARITTNNGVKVLAAVPSNGISNRFLPMNLTLASSTSIFPLSTSSASSWKTAVAATDSDQLSTDKVQGFSSSPSIILLDACLCLTRFWSHCFNIQQEASKYYFVVANAKFMLDDEEHFKELLFERLRNYGERNKERDFWLVIEPKFLDKFPNIVSRLRRPAVALVSTNGPWIT